MVGEGADLDTARLMISKRLKASTLLPIALAIVFTAWAGYRLLGVNSDVLYLAQDLSLWLPGMQFWEECLAMPGGWLTWVGRFLTQSLYYPVLGASLLIVAWLLIYLLLYRGLHLDWRFCWLAMLPPMLLLHAVTALGYAIYMQNTGDWWFTPTLFVLLLSLIIYICARMPRKARWIFQSLVLLSGIGLATQWADATRLPATFFRPLHEMAGDDNYHREIRMARAADECDWPQVIREYQHTELPPTRTMWILYNLALLNSNRLPDNMLRQAVATQLPTPTDSVCASMGVGFGPLLYYLHGQINFSYRWAMENSVNYGMSAQRLRQMTQCAILLGETQLAHKYLDILSRTLFHASWAEEQLGLLEHPSKLHDTPRYALPKALFDASPADILDGDNDQVESYLMNLFSHADSQHNASFNELCLFYALASHDIPCFWKQFAVYAQLHAGQSMPLICQEAAILYSQLQPGLVDVSNLPFDPIAIANYNAFMQTAMPLMQRGTDMGQIAQQTHRQFGHTFFWYYYFCTDFQIY